jgi:DUF917 family protein
MKLVIGATILGTGGGGDPNEGFKVLKEAVELKKKPIEIIDLEDLSEKGFIVAPYYVGSIAPDLKPKKPIKIFSPITKAFEIFEKEMGERIIGVVASEMGGFNTSIALSIGVLNNIPAVDGDLLGRAAPELHQCTVHIYGYPMTPAVLVSETGNIIVVKEYADIDDYESFARYVSVLSGRYVAVVDTPLTKDVAKKIVVKDTISLAYRLGEEVLRSREKGVHPAERVAEILKGWVVFKGVVDKYVWRNERGFLIGEAYIRGEDKYRNRVVKSYIMNEHIMIWIDNEPLVMPPDLFILLDENGMPITNTILKENMRVVAIAAPAPEIWRTPRGLELFGPKHFGFNYEYVPVEKLVIERGVI